MCSCGKTFSTRTSGPTLNIMDGSQPRRRLLGRSAPVPVVSVVSVVSVVPVESVQVLDSVDTSVWGAHLWTVLHICAEFSGTPRHVPLWRAVVSSLRTGIPCAECRGHFVSWADSHPLRFNNYVGFYNNNRGIHTGVLRWIVDAHNNANTHTGKDAWTLIQSTQRWSGNRQTRLSEAFASLQTIQGVIGESLFVALSTMISVLGS